MKSVLISIQPKWCELIASGKKTVEVRKTKPKLQTPFKVYIYCTKARNYESLHGGIIEASDTLYKLPTGVIKCDYPFELQADYEGQYDKNNFLNGKVIGEFVCDEIKEITADNLVAVYFNNPQENTCLNDLEMRRYADGKNLFLWHISNLVIYDKPKPFSVFWRCSYPFDCGVCDYFDGFTMSCEKTKRPPQSWCYVEGECMKNA